MKCANCGEELGGEGLYCGKCGKPVQMVPDYNEFDDYLDNLVGDESDSEKKDNISKKTKKSSSTQKKESKKKQQVKIIIASAMVCIVALIVFGITVAFNLKNTHESSFDYQLEQAEKKYNSGEVDDAILYYEKAISLKPDNIDVKYELAQIYIEQNETDAAMILLQEIINIDSRNNDAYRELISIYEKKKDYESIVSLRENISDKELLKLFEDYFTKEPEFSETTGVYSHTIELELKASKGTKIYYSTGKGDPIKDGKLYTRAIELDEERIYTISAVAVDDKGIYSEVVTNKYEIKFEEPQMPSIDPDGGVFGAETDITITIPDNCRVYYTWDSTNPTELSQEYTAPIPVPVGNNVLSVIAIDKTTGKSSGIYRSRFEFYTE